MMYDWIVIGGGAAGVFAAITAKTTEPSSKILLLEKTEKLLSKVLLSGGGRCNVTYGCFDPKLLVKNYPRGEKELLAPFHRFHPQHTIDWFENVGVKLKIEKDNRVFPVTDRSETIVSSLIDQLEGVKISFNQTVLTIEKQEHGFLLHLSDGTILQTKKLLLATGSSKEGYKLAKQLGHTIEDPIASLFAFNLSSFPFKKLSGIALENVQLRLKDTSFCQKGSLLFTHFGLSGPVVILLSSWGSRYLYKQNYKAFLEIQWVNLLEEDIFKALVHSKKETPQKTLLSENIFCFPKSFWSLFLELLGENFLKKRLGDFSLKDFRILSQKLHKDVYTIDGKTSNKEEFVTAGGIKLKEIDFKTMQSKLCPGLFFAGEILDIDGITGGFNLQNAWTTGFIAGSFS